MSLQLKNIENKNIDSSKKEVLDFTDKIVCLPKLTQEIYNLNSNGYEISIGSTNDEAYSDIENICQTYDNLDVIGKDFHSRSQDIIKRHLGIASLGDVHSSQLRKAFTSKESQIEEIRAELLFDETKMPWHVQRGSALALQTIVDAHELIAHDSDNSSICKYPTMSGSLPHYDSSFMFNEKDGSLNGLSLSEAIVNSRERFYKESSEVATVVAEAQLENLNTFFNTPVTQEFKNIVAYCYDSLGIRSRKQEVRSAVLSHTNEIIAKNPLKNDFTLLSIGCGTAQAILEVASDLRDKGVNPSLVLLDQDPIALAAAKNIAKKMGLEDNVEIYCERLFNMKGQLLDMTDILAGRKIDVAEDTGLREYLPDNVYRNLTKSVWNHLSEDGVMTTGNMNINRPQPEFLHGLMGWRPNVIMRNIDKGFELHEESGIPKGKTKARVTRDGVYTLFFSYK